MVACRRRIDADRWAATDANPTERVSFGAYATRWLTNRQVAGRPIKTRTRDHYQPILDTPSAAHLRGPPARRDHPQGYSGLV